MIVQLSYCTYLISPAVPLRPAVLLPAAKYSVQHEFAQCL